MINEKPLNVGGFGYSTKRYLNWHDISDMFDCGRNKAILIMHKVGSVHIGKNLFIESCKIDEYLAENGSIDVEWTTSKSRRKNGRAQNG